jgi:hypothetical protein
VKEFKLAKIIYVYWKNECTPKAWFVWVFILQELHTSIWWKHNDLDQFCNMHGSYMSTQLL